MSKCDLKNEETIHRMVPVEKIWIDYEFSINIHSFKVANLIDEWWQQNSPRIPFLKFNPSFIMAAIASHAYPKADVRQLYAFALSMIWTSCIDIFLEIKREDEILEYKHEFIRKFETMDLQQACNFSVYCQLILEIFIELSPYMTDDQKKRFKKFLVSYFDSGTKELRILREANNATLDDYIENRLFTICFGFYEIYGEVSHEIDITKFLVNETFKNMQKSLNSMLAYMNDIYSYNKELKANSKASLVYQVQKHYNCSSQRAMKIVVDMFREEKETFDKTSVELIEKNSKDQVIKSYVTAMRNLVMSNIIAYKYYHMYSKANKEADLFKA